MNTRRSIDYSQMYQAIDDVMNQKLPQMQLYCAIGRIVCTRSEKGAAVMASEYIRAKHPEVQGFSPRNLRRMRDLWRTYENHPTQLSLAMELGWTQNVVIMEADLSMELREWYLRAARQFGWSKTDLIAKILSNAHEEKCMADTVEVINQEEIEASSQSFKVNNWKTNNCGKRWKARKRRLLRKSTIRQSWQCFRSYRWRLEWLVAISINICQIIGLYSSSNSCTIMVMVI